MPIIKLNYLFLVFIHVIKRCHYYLLLIPTNKGHWLDPNHFENYTHYYHCFPADHVPKFHL